MARVAQHLECLQEGVEQRIGGCKHIHEHRRCAALQNAPRLSQPGTNVVPVMRAQPRHREIEARIGKRQLLHRSLLHFEVCKSAPRALLRNGRKHFRGEIVSGNLAHMRRNREARMSATAAQIERALEPARSRKLRKLFQIFAARMHRALHISRGPWTELLRNQIVNRVAHHFAR
ncbi:MAG TPA: hypothetical protein VMS78_12265 [Rhizomicrobium sp.]|nr:hypothetical protein [Rhizomicrobium sp.]